MIVAICVSSCTLAGEPGNTSEKESFTSEMFVPGTVSPRSEARYAAAYPNTKKNKAIYKEKVEASKKENAQTSSCAVYEVTSE